MLSGAVKTVPLAMILIIACSSTGHDELGLRNESNVQVITRVVVAGESSETVVSYQAPDSWKRVSVPPTAATLDTIVIGERAWQRTSGGWHQAGDVDSVRNEFLMLFEDYDRLVALLEAVETVESGPQIAGEETDIKLGDRQLEVFDYSGTASARFVVGVDTGRIYSMEFDFGDSTPIQAVSVQLDYSTPVSIEPPE